MRDKAQRAELFRSATGRVVSGLAATTGLTMVVALVAAPAYAQAPPALEQPDAASATAAAKQTGKRVKITGATTERAEFFATPDGKVTGVLTAGPARFRHAGSWVPIDLTLWQQPDGSVTPRAHPNSLRLSGRRPAGTIDLASMGTGANLVSIGWQGALPQPHLDGNKATYAEVRPGVDLVVQATATGFEQLTVVKNAAAAKQVSEINLPLSGAGAASVAEDDHGRVRVRGTDGKQKAEIPTPMMWDSRKTERGRPSKRRQVTTEVVTAAATPVARAAGSTTSLSLKPDQKWLTSADTVYPVTIDPYFDWSTTAASTSVVEGYASGWPDADSLFVGSWDSTTRTRSYVTWWANALQGMHIDNATAHFANPYSTSCTATPFELWTTGPIADDTSWANQPQWHTLEDTAAEETAEFDSEHNISYCNDSWITADATSFFQRAASGNVATPTMGLRAVDELEYNQYKQFWSHNYTDTSKFPYVEVTYSQPQAYDPAAFARLLELNEGVTAEELEASLRERILTSGHSYQEAIMVALAQDEVANIPEPDDVNGGARASSSSSGSKCPTKVAPGQSRYRGDIFYAPSYKGKINHGHAGLYYTKDRIIEAPGAGSKSADFAVNTRSYCKGVIKMDVATTIAKQNKAADYAYNNLRGKSYNYIFNNNKGSSVRTLNCSELVYKAYKKSLGIDLDGDRGLGVYPYDLVRSDKTRTYQTI